MTKREREQFVRSKLYGNFALPLKISVNGGHSRLGDDNNSVACVALGLTGQWNGYAYLSADEAELLGQRLLDAAKDTREHPLFKAPRPTRG